MVAYTKPQQMKKEESKRLRGEGDQTTLIDLRFESDTMKSYINYTHEIASMQK